MPRVHGAARQRYVASLGAIPNDPSTHDRLQLWQHANAKLAKLANLIDSTTQTKLRSEIHGHIPLPP